MPPPRSPAEIYGEQMYKAGHGYGLYEPERQVHPGDVGFLFDGRVQSLFNVLRNADDPLQHLGVPRNFQELVLPEQMWCRRDQWHNEPVFISSRTGVRHAIGVGAAVDPAVIGGQFRFDYASSCGAALVTRSPTSREDILPHCKTLKSYVAKNVESWYDFADTLGFDLKDGSLFLVQGCDNTAAWSLAEFSGSEAGLSFEFKIGSPGLASANVLLSGTWFNLPNCVNQRSGPASRIQPVNAPDTLAASPTEPPSSAPTAPNSYPLDQTVLIRILKVKRPFLRLPFKLKAAAEPQNPKSDDDLSENTGVTSVDGSNYSDEVYTSAEYVEHPLDELLDYILTNSDCQVAVVDDSDLYKLLECYSDSEAGITQILQQHSPQIEVANGVGQLAERKTATSNSQPAIHDAAGHTYDQSKSRMTTTSATVVGQAVDSRTRFEHARSTSDISNRSIAPMYLSNISPENPPGRSGFSPPMLIRTPDGQTMYSQDWAEQESAHYNPGPSQSHRPQRTVAYPLLVSPPPGQQDTPPAHPYASHTPPYLGNVSMPSPTPSPTPSPMLSSNPSSMLPSMPKKFRGAKRASRTDENEGVDEEEEEYRRVTADKRARKHSRQKPDLDTYLGDTSMPSPMPSRIFANPSRDHPRSESLPFIPPPTYNPPDYEHMAEPAHDQSMFPSSYATKSNPVFNSPQHPIRVVPEEKHDAGRCSCLECLDSLADGVAPQGFSSITSSKQWMGSVLQVLTLVSNHEVENLLNAPPAYRSLFVLIATIIILASQSNFDRAPFDDLILWQAENITIVLDSLLRHWTKYVALLDPSFTPSSAARLTLIRVLINTADKHKIFPGSLRLRNIERSDNPIGGGTFADVYKCRYQGQLVAVKQLRTVMLKENSLRSLFREMFTGAYLTHPNVLPIMGIDADAKEQREQLCLITPWVHYGSARSYMANRSTTSDLINHWISQVASGMAYLHDAGLVHSDLRGNNVLINQDDIALVADYGQAFLLDDPLRDVTNQGASLQWMAPELLHPSMFNMTLRPTKAADVYAFGCLVIELHRKQNPWGETINFKVHTEVLSGNRPATPNDGISGISSGLWRIINRCWQHLASNRPSMATVTEDINAVFKLF